MFTDSKIIERMTKNFSEEAEFAVMVSGGSGQLKLAGRVALIFVLFSSVSESFLNLGWFHIGQLQLFKSISLVVQVSMGPKWR